MTPPGVSLTRKVSRVSSGALLNEYERVSCVPGTAMLTYCPGRKASLSRSGVSTVNDTVVAESRSRPRSVPTYVAAWVLATVDVLAICSTRSDLGLMLHGSTYPGSASSSGRASER